MITSITVLSYEAMLERARDHRIPANTFVVSIIDPEEETITVLVLKPRKKTYAEHGVFAKDDRATSKLLPGFSVDVTETFARRP